MRALESGDGRRVGPYRVWSEVGRGGMGRVLLGTGPDGRCVAVKVVRAQFVEDEGFRARFRREVAASRRVSGGGPAVAVLDADADAPLPWMATEFVPGPSLREVADALGALPEDAVRRLAAGLAAALEEIHRAGLVHRDLKPSNVLLAAGGPRVIDFGIARATDSEGGTEITHTGWLVGSPGFMSPEQAEGRPVGPESDVFSLGAVLVLACTGRSPFAGASTPQTLYNVVHTTPDLSGVPSGLRELVGACLAKDPAQRPAPARVRELAGEPAAAWPAGVDELIARRQAEVGEALREAGVAAAFHESTTVSAPPRPLAPPPGPPVPPPGPPPAPHGGTPGPPAPAPAPRPGRRALLLGGAAVAVAAAVGIPLALRDDGSDTPSAAGDDAPSTSPTPDAEPGTSAPGTTSPAPTTPSGPQAKISLEQQGTVQAVAFSPDGRLLASGGGNGALIVWDPAAMRELHVLHPGSEDDLDGVGAVAFSPDGRILASAEKVSTTLWNTATWKRIVTLTDSQVDPVTVHSLSFSPNGKVLACGNAHATITLWDTRSHRRLATLVDPIGYTDDDRKSVEGVAFRKDGTTLAAAVENDRIRLWNTTTHKIAATITTDTMVHQLAYSPDGRLLAGPAADEVLLWDARTRKHLVTLTSGAIGGSDALDSYVDTAVFSPDGRSVAASVANGKIVVWDTGTYEQTLVLDGNDPEAPPGSSTMAGSVCFSPDGKKIAAALLKQVAVWTLP
ncbi:WD40 repeat domain-containing serine/threonine protein kinase [Streptomyces sp. NPDC020983]|uniref:WD40 repeat domain-containing serine/threonine protein kinase n=1 Tax=Streptomyces sp. NPDC020983 TaxID=3365106 RepID=UPI0037A8EDBA